jgi:cytochrome c biogenesis protein CcdA
MDWRAVGSTFVLMGRFVPVSWLRRASGVLFIALGVVFLLRGSE